VIGIHHAPGRDAKIERLRRVPLFAGCTPEQLAAIAQLADELEVPAGRRLIREGGRGHEFLVLVDGAAEVRRGGELVCRLGPGDFVGELSLLSGGPRTATVVTTTRTRLLVLTDRAFARIAERVPGVSLKLMRAVAARALSDATATPAAA
jgi:CRP-like cAMP-binding protein